MLAFETELGNALDGFDDVLENLIELALRGFWETPDFDYGHSVMVLSWFSFFSARRDKY